MTPPTFYDVFICYQGQHHPSGCRRCAPTLSMKYVHVLHRYAAASLHLAVQINSR